MRFHHHVALSSFWFGVNFHWLPISFVLLPSQVHHLVRADQQGEALGLMLSAGAVLGVVIPPLVGLRSDRLRTRWGRRRPVILVTGVMNLAGLFVMMTAGSYATLLAGYLTIQLFANAAAAAYAALIPDVVPGAEFGRASGYMAGMTFLGGGAGVGVAAAISALTGMVAPMYAVIAAVFVLSMVPVLLTARGERIQPPATASRRSRGGVRGFLAPIVKGDFAWVLLTRMMGTAGITIVASFLSFFFRDIVGATNPDAFTSLWLAIVYAVALPCGVVGGVLSDRYGRKRLIYLSGIAQAVVVTTFVALYPRQVAVIIGLGVLYGVGAGMYYSVDWALACDTLPDRANSAKDMGLFHVAQVLPLAIAPAIGGEVLDYWNLQSPGSGYRVVFASALVFIALATVFVSRIRSVR